MKAFHFRLEQALRWRSSLVDAERARVATAAALLSRTREDLATLRSELIQESTELRLRSPNGGTLQFWSAWEERARQRMQQLQAAEKQAAAALEEQIKKLVDADRQLQLLQNLKAKGQSKWMAELTRELENFAAETFLGRLQSKRTGA